MVRIKMWKPEEVEYLIENYHESADLEPLATYLNTTPNAVRCKANYLGFSRRPQKPRWTEEELELLEAWAETKPILELIEAWQKRAKAKGWAKRSPEAIKKAIHNLGASLQPEIGWYKLSTIQAGLETSQHAVRSWVVSGKLKAQKKGEKVQTDYLVKEADLVAFALRYPAEISERITPGGMCWLLQIIKQSRQKMWS